ncbi:MAG: nitrate- and nitrite sensing domain-containing protein [Jiangellaceae bacterium]|nr:nitrate- and nitrite sensing domain-containing protein [Jiangellaceae bacterium]
MTRNPPGHRAPAAGAAKRARADERAAKPGTWRERRQASVELAWRAFLHDRSVRARVALLVLLPLLGALVLGAFLFRDAFQRAEAASDVARNVRLTASALDAVNALQDERDVSGLFDVGATGQGAVADARNATDEALAELQDQFEQLPDDVDPAIAEARRATQVQLDLLYAYRGSRDIVLEAYDPAGVDDYSFVDQALLRFVKATGTQSGDSQLSRQVEALDALARATESASVERALLSHVLASGEPLSAAQRERGAISAGEQDYLLARFTASADPQARAQYYNDLPGTRGAVEQIRSAARTTGEAPRFTPEQWYQASTERINVLRGLQDRVSGDIVAQSSSTARQAWIATILTALVVLVVLAATVALAAAVARSITRPLRRLRRAALETADIALPALVSRIQSDGPAVVRNVGDALTPEGKDEIGQVATAFNDVHATAVRVAGEQALLRQNLDTIVVNLSRRTQSLVDRQLGEIEELESQERDPDQLSALFRIDHLATRVRRHAESLLVLAGVEEMRRAGKATPVLDVVRTAVSEVEQYPRVRFGVMPTDLVTPAAVDDVAHLLAELLDNATEFSAPSTEVTITSQPLLGGGLRIQVADAGIGIPPDELTPLNQRLREPGDIDVATSRTLGLYVVARLAARHDITVNLVPGQPNGMIAQIDLPANLLLSPLDSTPVRSVAPASAESAAAERNGPRPEERPLAALAPAADAAPPVANRAPAPGRPLQPVNGSGGGNGLHTRGRRPEEEPATPPRRSLRAPEPELPDANAPIFEAVKSAWFQRGGEPIEWSSPADEGWRRAAAALRTAEQSANARRAERERQVTAPARRSWSDELSRSTVEEPALSGSGLPVRRRGATLIPGSVAEVAGESPGVRHEATEHDADKVAATLSNLQRGVSRGREETGGWVPKRPDDAEGSSS